MRSIFFASVAHELKTPLNSIIPMIKLILENLSANLDETVRKFLKIIQNSASHLENVIEDALDISRLENNQFTLNKDHFNIKDAAIEVIDIMKL